MELTNFNVSELSMQEMITTNGGGKIGAALKAAWDAVCYAVEWVVYKIEEWYYLKRQEIYKIKDISDPDSFE
jgi:hypothetical protein